MANPRISAATAVQKILEEKIFFGELKKQISEKDLPFINMLVLTALRHWHPLKQVLGLFLKKKIPHKHRFADYLLMLAMTEILYMDTAVYAVIDETVKNIRKTTDKFLAGMANAVLRQIERQKKDILERINQISPLPASFAEILDGYDAEEIMRISQSVYAQPPLDITVKDNPVMLAEKLSTRLLPNGSLRFLSSAVDFNNSLWWIQDVAASLPVQIMGNLQGKKVLDLCAAPGGKTAQLAAGGAQVTALDISEQRLKTLQDNMKRLNFDQVRIIHADALEYLANSGETFDAVLLDAPCSATGTFRRHPEILHIKTKQDVLAQCTIQNQMLSSCSRVLKKGGILLYSVCSITKAEGEQQISSFLEQNRQFEIIPVEQQELEIFDRWQQNMITTSGAVRTLPFYEQQIGGMDAFFICKMKRII